MTSVGQGRSSDERPANAWKNLESLGLVWSVSLAKLAGEDVLVCGCADGSVRIIDLNSGVDARSELHAGRGAVLTVATVEVSGRLWVVSGGIDGVVRIWDVTKEPSLVNEMKGHTGGVRGVAAHLVDGAVLVASAGADGTVHVWDPNRQGSEARLRILAEAHKGSALAVGFGSIDGRTVLASGGDDLAVRIWDPIRGESIADLPKMHRGSVRSLAFSTKHGLFASASDDGTTRLWDPRSGLPYLAPLVGHTGTVRGTKFFDVDGSDFLATAGIDGTLRFWDPTSGHQIGKTLQSPAKDLRAFSLDRKMDATRLVVADSDNVSWAPFEQVFDIVQFAAPALDRSPVLSVDAIGAEDMFGRRILATHIQGVLDQLSVHAEDGNGHGVVLSVDGRWGSGKTTLARLLVDDLRAGSVLAGPTPALQNVQSGESNEFIGDPVVIEFDAWRESAVAPHWWSLASAINRGIRRERTIVARLLMTLTATYRRISSSAALLVVISALFGTITAIMAVRAIAPSQINDTLESVQAFLTAGSALFAAALIIMRSLFWSSPALGSIHVKADDNPLGDVVEMVSVLRRWTPRSPGFDRTEKFAFILVLALATVGLRAALVGAEILVPAPAHRIWAWLSTHSHVLPLVAVALFVLGWSTAPQVHLRSHRQKIGPTSPSPSRTGAAIVRKLRLKKAMRTGRILLNSRPFVVLAACLIVIASATAPLPRDARGCRIVFISAAVLLTTVVVCAVLRVITSGRPRRPLLLIIDELDRCPAAAVVAYLETVHTILRQSNNQSARFARKWRKPAFMMVLVLADGRWIRTAFSAEYPEFQELGNPVKSLGGDFMQKLFDHTVLVPELTASQVGEMLETLVSNKGNLDQNQGSSDQLENLAVGGADAPTATAQTVAVTHEVQLYDTASAANARSVRRREVHLLHSYSDLLPSNPRHIRRVTNAWVMLEALKLHLRHDEDDDTLIRAAIIWVSFPSLVDDLLSSSGNETIERKEEVAAASLTGQADPTWERADVASLLVRDDGSYIGRDSLARCFGRRLTSRPVPDVR